MWYAHRKFFSNEKKDVQDTSGGCGQAYEVVVVSELFVGKTPLAKARMTNEACADFITQLHAFSAKNFTGEQFAKLKQ